MSEELKPQQIEGDQPGTPEELTERELNDIAGRNGAGTGGHLGPAPGPGG